MSGGFDLVILGSGTTAFAAAQRAAARGARVAMVEQSQLGGTCVNWGCVPSKTLIHKAKIYFEGLHGGRYGLMFKDEGLDCSRLMAAKDLAVTTVRRERYQKVLDANPLIEVIRGHGRFLSPRELQVGAQVLVSPRFLIASGGVPRVPRLPGLAEVSYLTSYSALHLSCVPRSLLILGGGVIALEIGQMFQRFGCRVTVLERGDRPLCEFDPRLTSILRQVMAEEGMELRFGVEAQRIFSGNGEACVAVRGPDGDEVFRAERLMLAVGTAPASDGIGLEAAGVAVGAGGFIVTDAEMRTSAPGIWAAGDVTGPPLIAPAGIEEAEVATDNMFAPEAHRRIDHRNTPMAVFVDPEVAGVGLSAEQARAEGRQVVETFLPMEQVAKAHVLGERPGGILLVAERGSGRVLGVQMLAPRAADIIHEATLAVRYGLTVRDLAETVHVYPTISDGLRLAALENLGQQPR